ALSRPFSLDLSQLLGALGLSGTLASVANSLVGVGASGTISVNASAAFHLRLGLDLNTVSTGTTTQGDGTHNEVQTVVLKATGGSFKLSFPFSRAPQNVAAAAGTGGSLSAGDRFYVITALIGGHETTGSSEVSTTVADSGKVSLTWTPVSGAASYNVYAGTTSGGEDTYFNTASASFTDDGTGSGTAGTPPAEATAANQTTGAINWTTDSTALAADIQAKLEALGNIGSGNVTVGSSSGTVTAGSPQTFTITFQSALGDLDVADLVVDDGDLTGQRAFFIKTGHDGTGLHFDASASASNLNFEARIGPFGLFIKNGSAAIGGSLDLNLLDPHSNGRLVIVGFGGDGVTSDLGSILDFVGTNSIALTGTNTAIAPHATGHNTGGSLATGTYYYEVTAVKA